MLSGLFTRKSELQPRDASATLVSFRFVGLGAIVEKYSAAEAFRYLGILTDQIESVVNRHGGVFDRSFRNGFLAVFGGDGGHAQVVDALKCAWEIQTANAASNIEAGAKKAPVFSLKIGITSARVYIGGLGEGPETVLGVPVDTVTALAESCDVHSIVISQATRMLLREEYPDFPDLKASTIHVQNLGEPVVAYTLDPLQATPEIRRAAVSALRLCAELTRVDPRTTVKDPKRVMVVSNIGLLELRDVSRSGVGLWCNQALGLGVLLHLRFESADNKLQRTLAANGVSTLTVEVRWSKAADSGGAYCGVRYVGLEERLGDYLAMTLLQTQ